MKRISVDHAEDIDIPKQQLTELIQKVHFIHFTYDDSRCQEI